MAGEADVVPPAAGGGGDGGDGSEPGESSPPPPPPGGGRGRPGGGRYGYYALRRIGGGVGGGGCVFGSLEDCLRHAEGAGGDDGRGPEFAGFDDLSEASRHAFGDCPSIAPGASASSPPSRVADARGTATGIDNDQQETEKSSSSAGRGGGNPSGSRKKAKRAAAAASRDGAVTLEQLCRAGMSDGERPARLCGDLTRLQLHAESVGRIKGGRPCEVCGLTSYASCGMCGGAAVHFFPQRGPGTGRPCFLEYHSDHFFGLARGDAVALFGKRKKDWRPPTERAKRSNVDHIARLKEADL